MLRGIVAAALVCVLAGVAYADNKQVAKDAYSEGKRHYDLGDYGAALDAFKKAYLNYEEPVFLFNIAQCYRQLGDAPAAVRTYRSFLRNWPKAPNRETVERIVAELEAAIAQAQVAKSTPPQDTLAPPKPAPPVASATPTPTPAPTPAPASREAKPAEPTTPAPEPATVAAKPKAAAHVEDTGMVEIEPDFNRPSGSGSPVYKKWWFWTILGVAVAGVAAAAIAVPLTQGGSNFKSTLPDFTASSLTTLRAGQLAPATIVVRF